MNRRVGHSPGPQPGRDAAERSGTDPRRLQLHRPAEKRDVPYLPTDEPVVASMLRLGNVTENDVLYDLGCGDGRIVIAAARRGARAVGVDVDLQRIHESLENATNAGVRHKAKFLRESLFDVDLREATVVTLYLLPAVNARLRPKLLWELKPGTRVVSNYFDMGDWKPDATLHVHHRVLYLWVIPAWVSGVWNCVVNDERRGRETRYRMLLTLRRRYQEVWGTAKLGAGRVELPLRNPKLIGDRLSFTLFHPRHFRPPVRYTCRFEGGCLRGTCQAEVVGEVPGHSVWGGVRK
jgi:SAM-dependent methyltransferase